MIFYPLRATATIRSVGRVEMFGYYYSRNAWKCCLGAYPLESPFGPLLSIWSSLFNPHLVKIPRFQPHILQETAAVDQVPRNDMRNVMVCFDGALDHQQL